MLADRQMTQYFELVLQRDICRKITRLELPTAQIPLLDQVRTPFQLKVCRSLFL